jgi:two-component system, cell cycle sensor histidine kinase and response regulator CckA
MFALMHTDGATLLHWLGTISLTLSWLLLFCTSAYALLQSDWSATFALRQAILAQSPDAMCLLDADGVYRDGNVSAARLLGYDAPSDLIGLTLHQYIAPEDAQRVDALLADLQRNGVVRHLRLDVQRRDGSRVPVELSAGLLRSDTGVHRGMVVSLRDISERLSGQRALQDRERILRSVIDQSEDGIALMDIAGRVIEWNPALEEMSGVTREQVIGQPVWEIPALLGAVKPIQDISARVRDLVEHFLQTGEGAWLHKLQQIEIPTPPGAARTVQVVAFPIHVDRQWMAGAIARDISEWRRIEEHLHTAKRTEVVGRLAGGVAHEFNNLLTIINGYAQLLLQQLDGDHPLRAEVQQIDLAGQRAANLVRQLLAYARRQVLDISAMDVNDLLCDMEPRLRQMAQDIALHLHLDADLGMVEADRYQMREVIQALVKNACDAIRTKRLTGDGGADCGYRGTITVQTSLLVITENEPHGPDSTRLNRELAPGSYALLAIGDDGEGMSRKVQDQLFNPFFSTREVGQGTGLGLPMVYGIVQQLGGDIHVATEPGEGTAMSIYLPLEVRSGKPKPRPPTSTMPSAST